MRQRVIAFLSIAISCRTPTPISAPQIADRPAAIPAQEPTGARATVELGEHDSGKLDIRVIDASAAAAQLAVTPLSDAELQPLLRKLEPLPVNSAPAPAMRAPSAAPAPARPVTPISLIGDQGLAIPDTAPAPLPPIPAAPVAVDPLTAELLPSGEVSAAAEVHVRFSAPMIAVSAIGETRQPPATITPSVPGSWRWIDTRVARFTAATRFPSASSFTITVPAGTRGLSGGPLATTVTSVFRTPPISIERLGMRQVRPDAPVLLALDQPFDPVAIAKVVRIEHAGKRLEFQPTTLERAKQLWARDPRIKADKIKLPAHYLILEPKTAWPGGADLKLTLGVGAPSEEGPRMSTSETSREFSIAKPFTLRGISCGNRAALSGAKCPATSMVAVELSNSVPKWKPDQVKLDGAVADKDGGSYNVRVLAPSTLGTTHTVELDNLVDEFGQPLVGARTASFVTAPPIYQSYLTAESGLFILDPRFQIPQWKVEASAVTALRIQLYRVEPASYFAYRRYEDGNRKGTPPGKLIYDQQHAIGPKHAGIARVDLRPALDPAEQVGHVIGVATPVGAKPNDYASKTSAWIQVTKLGVIARFDRERVQAWASQIDAAQFLAPVPDAATTLIVDGRSERPSTAADSGGHAALEFPAPTVPAPKQPPAALLVVSAGPDSVFEAIDRHERSVRTNHAHWYVTDDRFTYKPREPVYVKGWVRWSHDGVNPDISLPNANDKIAWTLHDSRDVKLAAGTAALTAQGGFDLEAAIPETANLGTAHFTLESRGDKRLWPIQIEEFRTPTFSVSLDDDVTHRGVAPLYAGEAIELAASAKYYSGGGLAGARIKWSATLRTAAYVPPGWEDFTFSPPSMTRYRWRRNRNSTSDSEWTSLSGASSSSISVGIAAVPDGEPSVLQVDATVTDLDRATIRESSRPVIVHPSAYYVGIHEHPERSELELIVTDVDGKAVPGVAIDVEIQGIAADRIEDDDEPRIVDTQRCKLTSAATPVPCAWKRRDADTAYSAIAKVADARGRHNRARYYVPWWRREAKGPSLTIAADKAHYRPGDTAKLSIHSAETPAQAVVTIARQGMVAQRRIELRDETTIFELPIDPSFIRNVHVVVDRIAKTKTGLPETTTTEVELKLDPEHARLAVATRPTRPTVGPGERASFEVTVKHRGKPVAGAEVALLAVDEAVLAVSDKQHADPLRPFYFDVENATKSWTTLDQIIDAGDEIGKSPGFERFSLDSGTGNGYGVGGGRGGMRGRTASVPSVSIGSPSMTSVRRDFRATAVWSPKLITDAQGRAVVTVTMPDSLTRFRIVALATANTRNFGKAESTIATQRPLNVRATAPRFLSVGDRFSLPVIVQNLDRTPRTIDIGVRVANLIASGPTGKRVTIPAGQRAELRFDFRAQARGRAVIQTVAQSAELFDASQIELPIYVPATTESFATYGIVDGEQPAFEQLAVPASIIPDVGGVETDLFSSQISSLLDAFWYLQEYPFECAEQRSSRVLANVALVDVLDGFAAPDRPSRAEIDAQRGRDLRELERDHQKGGWGYFWRTSVDPFVTQQVVAALIASKAKGAWVDAAIADLATASRARIATLEKATAPDAAAISLAAAEVATLNNKALALRLHAIATKLGAYPIDAKARVLAVLAKQATALAVRKELLAQLLASAREDAATATITTSYVAEERMLLVSAPKTSALVLDALIREAPQHALIPKLARGLLDGRRRGRWSSTQENLAVLQAMRRYFDTYEKTPPDFTGKLWLGTAGYAEHAFAKRDARTTVRVPWTQLAGTQTLALAKAGPGRMYYRVGIQYAPAKLDLPPLDAGFVVRRSYTAVERPSDVTRGADGNYKVKLGSLVEITVEVSSTATRHGVALVDPLPAGFEPVNTRLATSEATTTEVSRWDHSNLRANRSEGFAMDFPAGTRRFTYTVRATTPGVFAAAPAKAEEMYAPETFGRTSGATVAIE